MKKELSVVLPVYNEQKAIRATLEEVVQYLRSLNYRFEVLVVSDGSTDDSAKIVQELCSLYPEIRLIHRGINLGKAETVKEGISYARYPYTLYMDADNSTRITEWPKFEAELEKGYSSVVGSRHMAGSRIVKPQPLARRFLGGGYRLLIKILFGLNISDTTCGFKAYDSAVAKQVYPDVRVRGWAFDTEVVCLLKKKKFSYIDVPVSWEHADKTTGIKPFETAFKTLGSVIFLKTRF